MNVTLKNGKRKADADIQTLLNFQNKAIKMVADGLVGSGEAQRYISKIEEIV